MQNSIVILLACLVVCTSFTPAQRPRTRHGVDSLKGLNRAHGTLVPSFGARTAHYFHLQRDMSVKMSTKSEETANTKKGGLFQRNLSRRWATGLVLGALCTIWQFSSNRIFTAVFLLPLIIAQQEYYTLVSSDAFTPTRKIGLLSAILCFVSALFAPQLHNLVLPLMLTVQMASMIMFNDKVTSFPELCAALWGLVYIGYLPSFWVRLKSFGAFSGVGNAALTSLFGGVQWMNASQWTYGSIISWFTWTSIVFADVGAYFFGKNMGKTKVSKWFVPAGAASPEKTIEGLLGGTLCASIVATTGAKVLLWPQPYLTGAAYGATLSFVSFLGDITASLIKRDSNVKDFGSVLPGHGGLLDRIDSFMFTGPLAFAFTTVLIPYLRSVI